MKRKLSSVFLALILVFSLLAGCGSQGTTNQQASGTPLQSQTAVPETPNNEAPKLPAHIEVWRDNPGYQPIEIGSVTYNWYLENTGVGVYSPYVAWDGGNAYIQKLQTAVASGEIPDMFLPWNGIESTLIEQGAVADLTDYLPQYAPNLWKLVPERVWDIVRTADPTGQGRIYYIPLVDIFNQYGSFVRQDWLDRVGMKMPQTQEELVNVFKAFRDQDANGNGDKKDEIPTSGREFGRWMDQLFGIYGIAMWEGFPMWDVYEGELTYSGVTKNMRDAIVWIKSLYNEKLLDNDTFLNQYADWQAKITSDKLGMWYHLGAPASTLARLEANIALNSKADVNALPKISAAGYEGFVTHTQHNRPQYLIADKNEETIIGCLKAVDWMSDPKNYETYYFGPEGMRHKVENGKKVLLPDDRAKMEDLSVLPVVRTSDSVKLELKILKETVDPSRLPAVEAAERIVDGFQKNFKNIAGDGMPANIYEGFPDIKAHALFQEYMSKIIIGDMPIEKFDEFVENWYSTGGSEVTKRAREWYSKVSGK